jgi:hypothetical protein
MGLVYADVELINNGDVEMARRHLMDIDDVKRTRVHLSRYRFLHALYQRIIAS